MSLQMAKPQVFKHNENEIVNAGEKVYKLPRGFSFTEYLPENGTSYSGELKIEYENNGNKGEYTYTASPYSEEIHGKNLEAFLEANKIEALDLFRQKKDTYIRNYAGMGYITSTGIFNDRVVNESGTVFLTALNREPQSIEQLTDKIHPQFVGVDRETIKNDAMEFYETLIEDGFVVKGKSKSELDRNDKGFTYNSIAPKTQKTDFTPAIQRADSDTQTFLEEHFNGKPHLTSFQIELTSKCNERCIHCYIPHEYKNTDIKPELYYSVLEQLNKMGVLCVTLSGGECMCHPQFVEFLRAAKKYDMYVIILSNLTLLNDEILAALKEGNVSSIQTSLYSMVPEHHDLITTVKGSFYKTRDAILKLIENDLPVHVSCPTMKANKDDYADVIKWCHEHKIRCQTDYIMMAEYNHETSNLANRLSVEEAGTVIKAIMMDDEAYKENVMRPDFKERLKSLVYNPERRLCGVGVSACAMVANGNVYPCPGWQGFVLGNLYKDTLENIWNNSEGMKWLRSLKMKDLGNGECCKCENAAFCAPCLVRNANEDPDGNPLNINRHFCAVAAKNKQIVLDWREKMIKEQSN